MKKHNPFEVSMQHRYQQVKNQNHEDKGLNEGFQKKKKGLNEENVFSSVYDIFIYVSFIFIFFLKCSLSYSTSNHISTFTKITGKKKLKNNYNK